MTEDQRHYPPAALWGVLITAVAVITYLIGVFSAPFLRIFDIDQGFSRVMVWSSGAPLLLGLALIAFDAIFLASRRRGTRELFDHPVMESPMTVVLTAYNDEDSIGAAVEDFLASPFTKRVLVIDNNSKDGTSAAAEAAGAIVHKELKPGYGQCVYRALTEASAYEDTDLVALCEGDMTFRAADLEKLASYARHAHVINGTRIVEQLRSPETQLTTFMFYGNFAVAKLLEFKHLGKGTISDVGTTYKLCRSDFLRENLGMFDPSVNLEFNAHFLDTVLGSRFRLVEVPITFYPRVGVSKGGNTSNMRATKVGLRMMLGVIFGWRMLRDKETGT